MSKQINDFVTLIEISENVRSELMPMIIEFIAEKDAYGLQEFIEDPENACYLNESEKEFLKDFIDSLIGKQYLN